MLTWKEAHVVKNPLAKAGGAHSTAGKGRSPGEGNGSPLWEIPWREEPGGYSPWGHKQSDTTEQLNIWGRAYGNSLHLLFLETF